MRSWRRFWTIFCAVQLAGVRFAILGIVHSFIAVMTGMILLPGSPHGFRLKAVEKLSLQQKQELIQFLGALLRAESSGRAIRSLPPAERAQELKRWAASHEPGPGLPNSAIGRDAIYD